MGLGGSERRVGEQSSRGKFSRSGVDRSGKTGARADMM